MYISRQDLAIGGEFNAEIEVGNSHDYMGVAVKGLNKDNFGYVL